MGTYTTKQARRLKVKTFAATATDGTAIIVKSFLKENALRKVREYDPEIPKVYRWNAPTSASRCDELVEVAENTFAIQYRN